MQDNSMQGNDYYPEMVDRSFVAKKRNAKKSKPENFVYLIVLAVEVALIVVLMIANYVAGANNSDKVASNEPAKVKVEFCNGHESKEDILSFVEDVSKEEAISVIEQLNTGEGCIPAGLIPEKLKPKPDELPYQLLFSYADVNELPVLAKNVAPSVDDVTADDFVIDENTGEYAIVSVDSSKVNCNEEFCYRGISFNKEHLDYREVSSEGEPKNEMTLIDMSPDFIKTVLGILLNSDTLNSSSLFDYYFDDLDDKFVMTGVYFGMGVDAEKIDSITAENIPYAINIYEKRLIVDKTTKKISFEEDKTKEMGNPTMIMVRSIALSDDEVIDIIAVVDGLSNEEANVFRNQDIDEDDSSDTERLNARVSAICGGEYSDVYLSSDNAGIFECDDSKEIYAVANPERSEVGYAGIAYATYLGTRNDEIADQYFGDKFYLFQDYRQANGPMNLILLTESTSEADLVEQNIDAIYDFVQALNKDNETELGLAVFYTDGLSQVKGLEDYVVLPAVGGYLPLLPHGSGFGKYYYHSYKQPAALAALVEDSNSYSSQVQDAIKYHRHIEANIRNGKTITKEALKELLSNSFVDGQ